MAPRPLEPQVEADRVMFGSDCPIFRTDWTLEAARAARLTDRDRDRILYGTAEQMLGEGS